MSATGLEVFDATVHKTNIWLNEVMVALPTSDRHLAYAALRAGLHALRDRITLEEVAQLGAQLPMLIRGIYYEGWDPTRKPSKARHLEDFLALITREFRDPDEVDAERLAKAVFSVLAHHVTPGEIEDIKQVLPRDLRELWPDVPPKQAVRG